MDIIIRFFADIDIGTCTVIDMNQCSLEYSIDYRSHILDIRTHLSICIVPEKFQPKRAMLGAGTTRAISMVSLAASRHRRDASLNKVFSC